MLFSPENACEALLARGGGAFLATKSGPGDHFWAEPIFAFHDCVILMYAHAGVKNHLISDLSTFVMDHTYQIGGDQLIYSDCGQIAMQEHVTRSYSACDHIEDGTCHQS